MLNPATRAAILNEAIQVRPKQARCAPYLESELQAYVEQNFEAHLADWFGPNVRQFARPVRLLGAQVPCATGQIDLLATIGELLVVVELKAQPVTERTVGQVMRYKAAVENALTRQIWATARARGAVYEGEARVQCMVIGPSFHPYAAETLDHFGWAFVARRLDDGAFAIADVYEGASEILLFHAEPDLDRLTGQLAADEVDRWMAGRK